MRPPNGAWMMSCIPPASSKKRSAMTVSSWAPPRAPPSPRAGSGGAGPRPEADSRSSPSRQAERIRRATSSSSRSLPTSRESSIGARGRLAAPERHRGRLAVRVLDPHLPAAHALHPPGGRAEQEHVAGHALDREVLVEGADHLLLGLGDHRVAEGVGDGAAVGERGDPRARAAPAASPFTRSWCRCTREWPREVATPSASIFTTSSNSAAGRARGTGRRGGRARRGSSAFQSSRGAGGDDLLREHVERLLRHPHRVELARRGSTASSAAHSTSSSRVSAKSTPREIPPLWWPARPTRWSITAIARGEPELDDEVHRADVDAQLERGGRDHHRELAPLQLLLGGAAAARAPCCRGGRRPCPAPSRSPRSCATRSASLRVFGEDEQRLVLAGELDEPVVDLPPHLVARDRRRARRPASRPASSHGRRWPDLDHLAPGLAARR